MNEKNEWIDNLSKLKNDFSQILYLIYYLHNIKEINKDQKILLKNLVILNKYSIFNLLKNLKETKNIKQFSNSIKKLIAETNINNTEIKENYDTNKSKHLITISNNSFDENNNEDNFLDDIKSPVNVIKKIKIKNQNF